MSDFWTGAALWLVQISVVASCLILFTLLLARFTRQPARRQRLCEAGLAAALLATAVSLAPAWLVIGVPLKTAGSTPVEPTPADELIDLRLDPAVLPPDERVAEFLPLPEPDHGRPAPAAESPGISFGVTLAIALLSVYGVGTLYFLVRWLGGLLILRRLLRHTEPAPPKLLDMLGITPGHGPRLLVSRRLRVPISCGVLKPTVVLPIEFCQADACARLRWVLAHELTHIERKDALSAVLFALGQVVFFHLPWFWMLRKQVRLCQEYVADASAVAERPADEYAEFLLTLTENKALPLLTTGVGGPVSDLFRRVTMLLQNPLRVEKRCPRVWTWGLTCGLLALAVLLGGVGLRAAADDTIIIIIPGKKTSEPAKDKTADAKKPAHDLLIRALIEKPANADVIRLILDEKGEVVRQPLQLPRDATAPIRYRLTTVLADPTAKTPPASKEDQERWNKVIKALEEIQRTTPNDKVLRDLFDLIKTKKASPEPTRERLFELYRKGVLKKDPNATPGTLPVVQPLPERQRYTQTTSPVDWKKLENLLEQLQKAPDKVDPKEIKKALDEVRKAAGKTTIIATPDVPYDSLIRYYARVKGAGDAHGRFGLRFSPLSNDLREHLGLPKEQGLVIEEVFAGTPAAKAGVKAKDIVLKLNDQTIPSDTGKAAALFANVKDGASVDLTILRRGKEEVIKGIKPSARDAGVRDLLITRPPLLFSDGLPEKGALVTIRNEAGKFTAELREKQLTIQLKGTLNDGKAVNLDIRIKEGTTEFKGTDANAVPEAWRQRVQRLLQLIRLQANPQSLAPEPRFRDNLPQGETVP